MKNYDPNISLLLNARDVGIESCSPDEPVEQMNEQEENEQIVRFEEDLSSSFGGN